MAFICLAKRKGGVGASTIAAALAGAWVGEGKRVVLLDGDPQQSLIGWAGIGEEGGTLASVTRPAVFDDDADLRRAVDQAKADADHVILDARPGLHIQAIMQAIASDVALLPCGPSPLDIKPLRELLETLHQLRGDKARPLIGLVPTRYSARTRLGRELPEALAEISDVVGVAATIMDGLALRIGYAECVLEGQTPEEYGGVMRDEARALAAAVGGML